MAHFTRREFLKTGLAAGAVAVSGALPLGVDLTRPEPYEATMGAMSRALDRLEALLDERP